MRKCEEITELLAAFADGGLDGAAGEEVERHVAGCAACRSEVAALREALAVVKAGAAAPAEAAGAEGSEKDEAFWRDFGRDTRLAYERAVETNRTGVWGWLRGLGWWPAPLIVVGAAILVVIFSGIGRRHDRERADGPRIPDGGVGVEVEDVDLGLEGVEDMNEEELDRVLTAFDDEEEGETTDGEPAETAEPYEAIEELDDDEIERVLDAFTKGV